MNETKTLCHLVCLSEVIHATHLFHQSSKQVLLSVSTLLINIFEVALVFLLSVDKGFDSVVAGFHAELDAFVQDALRLIGSVDISLRERLNVLLIVVDRCINDTISDSLGNDLLNFFDTLKAELLCDVSNRDLRVRDVDLLETELDDCVLQTVDQSQCLVGLEHALEASNMCIELFHVTLLHKVHDLVIWEQVLLEVFLVEDLPVWNLTHE